MACLQWHIHQHFSKARIGVRESVKKKFLDGGVGFRKGLLLGLEWSVND